MKIRHRYADRGIVFMGSQGGVTYRYGLSWDLVKNAVRYPADQLARMVADAFRMREIINDQGGDDAELSALLIPAHLKGLDPKSVERVQRVIEAKRQCE